MVLDKSVSHVCICNVNTIQRLWRVCSEMKRSTLTETSSCDHATQFQTHVKICSICVQWTRNPLLEKTMRNHVLSDTKRFRHFEIDADRYALSRTDVIHNLKTTSSSFGICLNIYTHSNRYCRSQKDAYCWVRGFVVNYYKYLYWDNIHRWCARTSNNNSRTSWAWTTDFVMHFQLIDLLGANVMSLTDWDFVNVYLDLRMF